MRKFTIYTLPLLGAGIAYSLLLRNPETAFARAIKSIPLFQDIQKKIARDAAIEIGKLALAYAVLYYLKVR